MFEQLNEIKGGQGDKMLHTILDATLESVFLLQPDGVVVMANENGCRRMGVSAKDLIGKNIYDFLPPDLVRQRKEHIRQVVNTRQAVTFEDQRGEIHFSSSIYPFYGPQGDVIQVVVYGRDITESKRAQVLLSESEARYRSLFNSMQEIFLVCEVLYDAQGNPVDIRYLDGNTLAVNLMHTTREEIVGRSFLEAFAPSPTFHALLKNFDRVARGEGAMRFEQHVSATGRYYTVSAYSPAPGLCAVIMSDISERKHADEALRASEEKYRGLIESLENVVATVERDGRLVFVNDRGAQELGRASQDMVGLNLAQVFPPAAALQIMERVERAFQGNQRLTFEIQLMLHGQLRWYRATLQPLHDPHGRVVQVMVNATDIHDLKTTQQKLLELNRTLEERIQMRTAEVQDLYDRAPNGYHSVDAGGTLILINQTELDWLGYTRSEVVGKMNITQLMTPESAQKFQQVFPVFLQQGKLNDLELDFVRKDGSLLPVLVTASAVYDPQGRFMASRSTILDNTERKKAQDALRESETRLRTLSDNLPGGLVYQVESGANGEQRRFSYISAGVQRLHGCTPAEVMQNPMLIYGQASQEDLERVFALEAAALKSMTPFSVEIRALQPSGEMPLAALYIGAAPDA